MALIDRSKNKSTVFRDISLSFVRHPVTNDLGIFSNEDAIRRSVTNLTRTRLGERFHNDLIGTQIDDSMFELHTVFDAESIQDAYSIFREFEEWIEPDTESHEIFSLEYIGDDSEYH